jgi:hypothetical protein
VLTQGDQRRIEIAQLRQRLHALEHLEQRA